MKISRLFRSGLYGAALIFLTTGVAYASELNVSANNSLVPTDFSTSSQEENRYVGDNLITERMSQPMSVTRAAGFIGRVDAHNAHKSGSEVSGHVSWTLISGASRKMEVQSTLKAKTGWFGYSTKAVSGRVSVWPGGGRGKAAVARYQCRGTTSTNWYTYGEGFAPGTQKPWGFHKGTVVTLNCGA